MWRMAQIYIASYVGRLAPPGYPNTTSTPSALRHSMIASTARIIACANLLPVVGDSNERSSLSADGSRFGRYGDFGEVQLGPAAGAELVVELDDLAAVGALPAQLGALRAVEHGGEQAEDRKSVG